MLARYSQGIGIDEPLGETRSGATNYYEQDGLGSVTSLSSSGGSLANTYGYDSFGNLTTASGTVTNPFQYTGRDYDPETGLRYYRARYYDPTSGRFLSEDPIGFLGGVNFYSYVHNNSLLLRDPFGMCPMCMGAVARGSGVVSFCNENPTGFNFCGELIPVQSPPPVLLGALPIIPLPPDNSGGNGNAWPDPSDFAPPVPSPAHCVLRDIQNQYDAYRDCVGDHPFGEPKLPVPTKLNPFNTQRGPGPDFGSKGPGMGPEPPPMQMPDPDVVVGIGRMKNCLRRFPLAILDPRFNDIQASDIEEPVFPF
ncbi:MAG TPA: RHS repeat-associated core domain-containing protein [Candidatus Angelobacter sp.]|nr:RHS repeat-associated core domain-containing protein [Candidatus Angelobacter sp.]